MKRSWKHINAQRQGRERDLGTCQICGSKKHTEGHHLIDFVFGGAADKDNIVTLCTECHKNVHKGLIDLFKF
ncbi:MAG: HNH endonuclease signature motif containing protein [Oscillospiraceae bacterium]|nr:HNH endonuclease signature motif containing protein [Oscillospiraceae bacterium]